MIIILTELLTQFIKVFPIERAVARFVMKQRVGTVDRVVGSEQHLFTAVSSDCLERRGNGDPSGIAEEVRQLAQKLQRLRVVGTEIHVYHYKVNFGMALRRVIEMRGHCLLTAARVGNNGQRKLLRELINRFKTLVVGRDKRVERMQLKAVNQVTVFLDDADKL